MNNQELENKVKEIIAEENLFTMIEKAVEFEKEYKTTDFYKHTKMNLTDVIKYSKVYYSLNINTIFNKIQAKINELDLTNLMNLLDQLGSTFGQENAEIFSALDIIKELQA